ncbi:MAG: hypothetical protein JSW11_09200 [Candidatus Heimdallarchaeota archaeon]|nr:MAG: hypothetical protein JSW11_09200 [Candidatus Heimdallarchaeota archaeon]
MLNSIEITYLQLSTFKNLTLSASFRILLIEFFFLSYFFVVNVLINGVVT